MVDDVASTCTGPRLFHRSMSCSRCTSRGCSSFRVSTSSECQTDIPHHVTLRILKPRVLS